MSTKSIQDHISPLFIGVDQLPVGGVVIICDVSMKEEAEILLSTLVSTSLLFLALLCRKLLLCHVEQLWKCFSIILWKTVPFR